MSVFPKQKLFFNVGFPWQSWAKQYWQEAMSFALASVVVFAGWHMGLTPMLETWLCQSLLQIQQNIGTDQPGAALTPIDIPLWLLIGMNLVVLGGTSRWRWSHQLLLWAGLCGLWGGVCWLQLTQQHWLPLTTPLLWFSLTATLLLLLKFLTAFYTLRRNETRYALMMQGFNEGLWDWNLQTNSIYFSPRWKQMAGYSTEEISSRPQEWFDRVHPLDRPGLEAQLSDYLAGLTAQFEQEYRLRLSNGSYGWMQSRGLAIVDAGGQVKRLIGSQTDITAQKQVEEALRRSTFFDQLTDLPSWTGFIHHLQDAIDRVHQDATLRFAVLWLDLDQFKLVNNSLGRTLGDHLLVAIAERLKSFLSSEEVVARLGEDEFAVLLQPIQDVEEALRLADQIQQVLALPFMLNTHEVVVTASVGIAIGSAHHLKPEQLLRDAGTAMYRAKAMGRASCLVFDKSMRTGLLVKLRLENDLRRAIAAGERQTPPQSILPEPRTALSSDPSRSLPKPETVAPDRYPGLELYYQPIVSLTTGQVAGFEALVRWQHAEEGLLFPSRFISMAEETGLIIPLSWWVLRTACHQMSQWCSQFPNYACLTMSVNLSSKQFSMPGLKDRIQQILQEANLEPTHLKLELTESLVMEDVAGVTTVLNELQALGIRLAIDDFGTGYSSLSYLPRFPLTTLKIDQSFVHRLGDCNDNLEIVRTILSLAHKLRLDVVAEGVETEGQATKLREMGCEYGQGYFFHKPLNVETATQVLARS
jgi:diguanylate cyclase (GGDEF)-like protein/PAS domain S-box-containing protein